MNRHISVKSHCTRKGMISIAFLYSLFQMVDSFAVRNSPLPFTHSNGIVLADSSSGVSATDVRSFVRYPIYKGKCALCVRPIPPTFAPVSPTTRNLAREGGILLEFAPTSGVRAYDWTKKTSFLLDATECGAVVMMDTTKQENLDFFHDPNMGSSKQGEVSKKLQIYRSPDAKAMFLSLLVKEKSETSKTQVIPLTLAEFYVFQRLLKFSIPRLIGFDCIWGGDNTYTAPTPEAPPAWKVINPDE